MPRLEMRTGRHAGKTFDLTKPVILGRGDNVGIRVPDGKASREHCRVFLQAGKWVVVDLNSRNGITVNGSKTTRKELVAGDEIAIGETTLTFRDEVAEMESVAPMAMPGEIEVEVDEIDLGGDDDPPPRAAAAKRPAAKSSAAARKPAAKSGKSAKDAAFAKARADAAGRAAKASGRGAGSSGGETGIRVSDDVLQFNRIDANKASPFSMDLSQYPVLIQIAIVVGGLAAVGAVVWLIIKLLGGPAE